MTFLEIIGAIALLWFAVMMFAAAYCFIVVWRERRGK